MLLQLSNINKKERYDSDDELEVNNNITTENVHTRNLEGAEAHQNHRILTSRCSFGKHSHDEMSILVPLAQCCR